jgi:predicted nucleotide-binding protein
MAAVDDELADHITTGSELDPEDTETREDWYERGKTLLRACGADADLQKRFAKLSWEYRPGVYFAGQDTSDWPRYSREIRASSMKDAVRLLTAAADERRLTGGDVTDLNSANAGQSLDQEVFIVYGHDHAFRSEVEIFLAKVTGSQPVVFDREPSHGSETVIEKLERLGMRAGFAVVLMTPDDVGGTRTAGPSEGRARQNVLIELGWFAGRLGRSRVRIVRHPDAAIPSDLSGVLYTSTDGNWQTELAKDLSAAGIRVNLNALLG